MGLNFPFQEMDEEQQQQATMTMIFVTDLSGSEFGAERGESAMQGLLH